MEGFKGTGGHQVRFQPHKERDNTRKVICMPKGVPTYKVSHDTYTGFVSQGPDLGWGNNSPSSPVLFLIAVAVPLERADIRLDRELLSHKVKI